MKKWVLNLVLAIAVLFLGGRIYDIWSQPPPLPPDTGDSRPLAAYPVPPPSPVHRVQPSAYYDPIVRQNLFSSERGQTVEEETVTSAKAAEESRFAKNIVLYGIVSRDDQRSALVSMGSSARSGTEYTWVQVGDRLGQVTVVGIENNRIQVREGSSTFEIRLDDRGHPSKRAVAQRSQTPTVITSKETAPDPRRVPPPAVQQPAPSGIQPPASVPPTPVGNKTEG
jgi:hypothetical protein